MSKPNVEPFHIRCMRSEKESNPIGKNTNDEESRGLAIVPTG